MHRPLEPENINQLNLQHLQNPRRYGHLSFDLRSLKASVAVLVWENLCYSCGRLERIPGLLLLLSLSLTHSLSLCLSLSLHVAGNNKGLTGRAWRSWLLDGKGESHSWVGQASSLAKVMSCVHGGGGVGVCSYLTQMFFSFLTATWFGEGKAPGPFDEVQGVSKTEGWWLWASQEVEILSKHCVFVYMSSSNTAGGVHTCCFFSSIWASVTKVARAKL